MLTNARATDPSESAAAFDPDDANVLLEIVAWLYTLGPATDEQITWRYEEHRMFRRWWPNADPESVRKRCSDLRRVEPRLQKVGTAKSSHGRTVGRYGYVEVAAA